MLRGSIHDSVANFNRLVYYLIISFFVWYLIYIYVPIIPFRQVLPGITNINWIYCYIKIQQSMFWYSTK